MSYDLRLCLEHGNDGSAGILLDKEQYLFGTVFRLFANNAVNIEMALRLALQVLHVYSP